ncbi:MAG: YjcQ family protein [Anaerocolumna sp.]
MFKSTKEFDSAIKEILEKLRDGENIGSITTALENDDFYEALSECVDRRYLSGLSYQRTADGKPHFSQTNIRVTYSGLSFIESR